MSHYLNEPNIVYYHIKDGKPVHTSTFSRGLVWVVSVDQNNKYSFSYKGEKIQGNGGDKFSCVPDKALSNQFNIQNPDSTFLGEDSKHRFLIAVQGGDDEALRLLVTDFDDYESMLSIPSEPVEQEQEQQEEIVEQKSSKSSSSSSSSAKDEEKKRKELEKKEKEDNAKCSTCQGKTKGKFEHNVAGRSCGTCSENGKLGNGNSCHACQGTGWHACNFCKGTGWKYPNKH